jgi:non-canonical poly(A) RNA polymerase PAPD5/7
MQFFGWIDPVLRSHRVVPVPQLGVEYLESHQPPPDDPDFEISGRLSGLIRALVPTPPEVLVRQHIVDLLCLRIPGALVDLQQRVIVAPCGSSLSGTCLRESDIDLALFVYPIPVNALRLMERLEQELADLARPNSFQAIPQATVPVLKFTIEPGVQVDLAIDELQGPLSVPSVCRLFAAFPVLLPAQIFLKCVLRKRQLDQPYTGGIASYTLQLMVLAYLQHSGERPLLVDFIRGFCAFYGTEFNFTLTGIDVVGGGRFFSRADEGRLALQSPTTMHINDPFKPGNVLGHNSFRIGDLRAVLRAVREILDDRGGARWEAEFQAVLAAAARRQAIVEEYVRANKIG